MEERESVCDEPADGSWTMVRRSASSRVLFKMEREEGEGGEGCSRFYFLLKWFMMGKKKRGGNREGGNVKERGEMLRWWSRALV